MTIPAGFNEPYPSRDPIVKENRKASDVLVRWEEQSLLQRVNQTPFRVQAAEVLGPLSGSTSGTLGGDQSAGLYRVTYTANVLTTQPGSSLQLTLGWTFGATARTRVFTAMDGSIAANEQGLVYSIEIDPGTPISYSLAFVGATMSYDAAISAELVQVISR